MNKKCVCNKCEKEFRPEFTHEAIGKDKNGGDVVQTYFVCPNCNARYNSFISDSIYDDMLAHYRKFGVHISDLVKNNANPAAINALINKMNNYEKNTMKPYYAQMKEYWQSESKGVDAVDEGICSDDYNKA